MSARRSAVPSLPSALRPLRVPALATALLALSACSAYNNYVPSIVTPYRADVQQGNWVTQEMVSLLRPGMTREQVRFALGSPALTDVFHADRWDYPYAFTPGYGKTEQRLLTVYFENERLARWTGDEMPDRQPFQKEAPPRAVNVPLDNPAQRPPTTTPAAAEGASTPAQTPAENTAGEPAPAERPAERVIQPRPAGTLTDPLTPGTSPSPRLIKE